MDWIVSHSDGKHLHQRLLPNFLSLSNKESVIVIRIITVHTLRKEGEIQRVSVITGLSSSLVPMTQPKLAKWLR